MLKRYCADIAVIGGGIVGVSVAYFLAKQGQDVVLIERRGLASEASGANMGLITQVSQEPGLLLKMVGESACFYRYLQDEEGIDLEYVQPGGFKIYADKDEARQGSALVSKQQLWGLPVEYLSKRQILGMEPALSKELEFAGGAFCPLDGFLNPFRATIMTGLAARRLGVELLTHTEVTGIGAENGKVRYLETSRGRVYTDLVINAAGAWAPLIARMVGEELPITPARGQVLVTEPVPRFMNYHVLGISARQTKHGSVLIGSVKEYVGYNKQNDPLCLSEFAGGAMARYPRLEGVKVVRAWANLRAATPDEKPILGRSLVVDGLIHAAGCLGMGMGWGPASGRMIADLVCAGRSDEFEELSLARFDKSGEQKGSDRRI